MSYLTFRDIEQQLKEALGLARRIKFLGDQIRNLHETYTNIVHPLKGDGGGRSNLPSDPVGDLATEILTEDSRLAFELLKARAKRQKVKDMIETYCDDDEQREVLIRKYIMLQSYETIQEEMYCSARKMFTLRSKGIQAIQRRLNEIGYEFEEAEDVQ